MVVSAELLGLGILLFSSREIGRDQIDREGQWCEDASRSVWLESLKSKLNDISADKLRRLADDLIYLKQLGRQLFLSYEGYIR